MPTADTKEALAARHADLKVKHLGLKAQLRVVEMEMEAIETTWPKARQSRKRKVK